MTNRLHKAAAQDRKHILGKLRDVFDELEERELNSSHDEIASPEEDCKSGCANKH